MTTVYELIRHLPGQDDRKILTTPSQKVLGRKFAEATFAAMATGVDATFTVNRRQRED